MGLNHVFFPPLNTYSFQLTVEMFDYLECELNLFLGGKFKVECQCLSISKVLSLAGHFGCAIFKVGSRQAIKISEI